MTDFQGSLSHRRPRVVSLLRRFIFEPAINVGSCLFFENTRQGKAAGISRPEKFHKLGYVPALDGLRAIAVLSVVVQHSGITIGIDGVDVFFVLSGFLITTLLVQEWITSGRISIFNFYLRRTLRLWPALWAMVFAIGLIAYVEGIHLDDNRLGAVSALLYICNWMRAFNLGNPGLFGHTWSLGVEEQFYIAWGLLLPWCLRTIGVIGLRWLTIATLGAVVVWREVLISLGASVDRIYNGFDTHAHAILIGCVLALCLLHPAYRSYLEKYLQKFPFLGCACLLGLVMSFSLLVSCVLTAVVIADVVLRPGFVRKLLEFRILVRLGVISYGIYLWHYPLILLSGYAPKYVPDQAWAKLFVGGFLGIAMAELSYRLIETPFLRLKSKFGQQENAVHVESPMSLVRR